MDALNEITDLLYAMGEPMHGSAMSDEEALAYARRHFPYGNYCLVRDWIWVTLDVTEEQRLQLVQTQREPALICAHTVVYDSERRWDVGDFVRTSLLHQLHEGFHFKTLNTLYLLLGPGTRKYAKAETVARIV